MFKLAPVYGETKIVYIALHKVISVAVETENYLVTFENDDIYHISNEQGELLIEYLRRFWHESL